MAYRFRRDAKQLSGYGLGSLAHVPFLLSSEFIYLDEMNRYLVERANGLWHPNRRDGVAYGRVIIPSANTVRAYSADLENWATYLEQAGLDWRRLTYQETLSTYDLDMSQGRWSAAGNPLSASTINRRVDRAVEFMTWAADRSLRPPLNTVTTLTTRRLSPRSGEIRQVQLEGRSNRHRLNPKRLRLPRKEEIEIWLEDVRRRSSPTHALMCEAILETGMRLEETAHLRDWQLPDIGGVAPGRPARMEVCFGTKGGRRTGDASLKGKSRYLRFEPSFLRKLINYRDLRRKEAVRNAKCKGRAASDRLFLSEKTGRPINPASLYLAWGSSKYLPFEGFSPHLGRHFFACTTLMRLVERELAISGTATAASPAASIEAARTLVSTYIRPVLGHVSASTTDLYLDWLADELWTPAVGGSWSGYLEQ